MIKNYMLLLAFAVCYGFNCYAQTLTEVFVPQYMQGIASETTNSNRIPYTFMVTISGLTSNATYRYYNSVVNSTDIATSNGAGNVIFQEAAGSFIRSTSVGINAVGGYSTFTSDNLGNYTGWFITEATGNARFLLANGPVNLRILLNNGAGGTTVATRLTTISQVTLLPFGSSATSGTGIRMSTNSNLTPSNFVMLYDNTAGTGRPIAGSFVENDGTDNSTANSYAAFYGNNVNTITKTFGTILPNTLPDGIKLIREYNLTDGSKTVSTVSDPAAWPKVGGGTVSTINPSTGTTEIALDGSTIVLPISIISFIAQKTTAGNQIAWTTANAINFSHFELERQTEGRTFSSIATLPINTSNQYAYIDDKFLPTTNFYRLKMIDKDGSFSYSKTVAIINIGNGFAISSVYPTVTKGTVTIEGYASHSTNLVLNIYNISGQKVMELSYSVNQSLKQNIDISNLPQGAYILRFINGINDKTYKIVKE